MAKDKHGKHSDDKGPIRKTKITGQAGTAPGRKGMKEKPFTPKRNVGGYGKGEPDDPKGGRRKPR